MPHWVILMVSRSSGPFQVNMASGHSTRVCCAGPVSTIQRRSSYWFKTVSAQTLLAKHAVGHIDLLQVDAEGFDFEVIKMFLAAGSLPTVINYEHLHLSDTNRRSCVAWLGGLGYKMLQAGPERIDTVAYRSAPADP